MAEIKEEVHNSTDKIEIDDLVCGTIKMECFSEDDDEEEEEERDFEKEQVNYRVPLCGTIKMECFSEDDEAEEEEEEEEREIEKEQMAGIHAIEEIYIKPEVTDSDNDTTLDGSNFSAIDPEDSQVKLEYDDNEMRPECSYSSDTKQTEVNNCNEKGSKIVQEGNEKSLGNEKPYSCNYCAYKCTKQSHLIQHERRTHTMKEYYSYNVCNYNYRCARPTDLIQHNRTHTMKKYYSCEVCDFKCSVRSYLVQHNSDSHSCEEREAAKRAKKAEYDRKRRENRSEEQKKRDKERAANRTEAEKERRRENDRIRTANRTKEEKAQRAEQARMRRANQRKSASRRNKCK